MHTIEYPCKLLGFFLRLFQSQCWRRHNSGADVFEAEVVGAVCALWKNALDKPYYVRDKGKQQNDIQDIE